MNPKFICAQPATIYFYWQLVTLGFNLIKTGIPPKDIYFILSCDNGIIPDYYLEFSKVAPMNIVFIPNDQTGRQYIPSLRPHVMAKFMKNHPELEDEYIFYHDSDIIFNKQPDWSLLMDGKWKVSDTIGYIGYDYIVSKGTDVLLDMCDIVKIPPSVVRANQNFSGGCQYLMKGTTVEFWEKVERDCEELFTTISNRQSDYAKKWSQLVGKPDTEYHAIQIWCADMWAVLWNAWKNGFITEVVPELAFSWGTSKAWDFDSHNIFHNAGVLDKDKKTLFYKGEFTNKVPFDHDFSYIDVNSASLIYVNEIKEAKKWFDNLSIYPKVSCVMATKGRFQKVRRTVAAFLAQTYPNKELIIYNNAETPIILDESLTGMNIRLINQPVQMKSGKPYTEIDQIFKDAISFASGEYFIEWDDDDFYLPNHLETAINRLKDTDYDGYTVGSKIWSQDSGNSFDFCRNVCESAVVSRIDKVRKAGFKYTKYIKVVAWRRKLNIFEDNEPLPTFCYVWNDNVYHYSGNFNDPNNFDKYTLINNDFGDIPLTPNFVEYNRWLDNINFFFANNGITYNTSKGQ